jgi:hypothetical protein
MNLKSKFLKWFGVFSTALLNTVVLLPNTFNTPIQIRPWLFVINVFWFLTVCSGIFNS